jgi:tRNA1(Val) A37 N6-methylase TrmN6
MSYARMAVDRGAIEFSEDAVLGGRLRLRQPLKGHRVGHDAILLAAATAARPGEHAVDLGAGVGAAGLALALRVAVRKLTLVEVDKALCALAAENTWLNGLDARVDVLNCDVEDGRALAEAGLAPGSVDRVLMNPPFNDQTRQNVSPDARRRLAHAAPPGLLGRWVATATRLLKPQGVLTLIWRADGLDEVVGAIGPELGGVAVLPVVPRAGAGAIRVLVRAAKGGRGARIDYPPLVLNDAHGRPTAAAEAVLRGGETLKITQM